jgi:hypothetical protein
MNGQHADSPNSKASLSSASYSFECLVIMLERRKRISASLPETLGKPYFLQKLNSPLLVAIELDV